MYTKETIYNINIYIIPHKTVLVFEIIRPYIQIQTWDGKCISQNILKYTSLLFILIIINNDDLNFSILDLWKKR